jgi:hypothetical protein
MPGSSCNKIRCCQRRYLQGGEVMTAELTRHPRAREGDNPDAEEGLYNMIEARTEVLMRHPRLGPRPNDIRSRVIPTRSAIAELTSVRRECLHDAMIAS